VGLGFLHGSVKELDILFGHFSADGHAVAQEAAEADGVAAVGGQEAGELPGGEVVPAAFQVGGKVGLLAGQAADDVVNVYGDLGGFAQALPDPFLVYLELFVGLFVHRFTSRVRKRNGR